MNIDKAGEVFLKDDKTGEYHKLGKTIDLEIQKEPVEQWKRGGDCNKCRRKKYCGTPCKASGERKEALLHKAFTDAFMNVMKGK